MEVDFKKDLENATNYFVQLKLILFCQNAIAFGIFSPIKAVLEAEIILTFGTFNLKLVC